MAVVAKRIPILDSIYKRVETMLIAEGFKSDWLESKSIGNGSSASIGVPQLNVAFKNETPSPLAGQSIYHLSAPIIITAFIEYDEEAELNEQDYAVQEAHSAMVEDIRFAFGVPSVDMCLAGVNEWTYVDELEEDIISGSRVIAKMEFQVNWRDSRL